MARICLPGGSGCDQDAAGTFGGKVGLTVAGAIGWQDALWLIDAVVREAMLFAAVGFVIGGIDDLAVDLVFFVRAGWRRLRLGRPAQPVLADYMAMPPRGRIAIFIGAWDESAVIGTMLATTLARLDHPDYRLYVGTYPNDRATIDAVAAVAERDPRVRLVIGPLPGPTTKAGCLNTLWQAMRRDEAIDGTRARAVVLHDAEDVVHPGELRIFDALVDRHWAVQLPVLPLIHRGSRLVSGHYADEFAEAHAKQLVVREALGAALPLAGVGCAIARDALEAIADARGGDPFDAASLTEDYELGLAIAALGGSGVIARVPEQRGGPVVAVRAYFPATIDAAVRQKTRWMIGIALAGWDRVGWGRRFDVSDHWMRMRDRRAPISVIVLAAAYFALVGWAASALLHVVTGLPVGGLPLPHLLIVVNAVLLGWRLAMRAAFTGAAYGLAEACWSVPRALVSNLVSLLAARRAIARYIGMLRGKPLAWEKTAHVYPSASVVDGRGNP